MDKQKIADELGALYAELRHVNHELEKAGLCEDEKTFARWDKNRKWLEGEIKRIREAIGMPESPSYTFS